MLRPRPRRTVPPSAFLLLLGAGIFVALAALYGQDAVSGLVASSNSVAAWVAAHPVSGGLLFLVAGALGKVTPFPGGLTLMLAGGFLFGPVPGALLSALGAALSALLVAVVGRRFLFAPIHARWGHRFAQVEDEITANSFPYLLAARLLPVIPAWLVNLLPVAFAIRLPTVGAATFLGLLPVSFIVASLGARLGDLAAAEASSPMLLLEPPTLLPLLALATLALVPVAWKHRRRRRQGRR